MNESDPLYRQRAVLLPPPLDAPPANVFRVRTTNGDTFHAYEFPHPAVAATVVVQDVARSAFLAVQRAIEPYRGRYAFPGGFLDVGRERIEETASRELFEEVGLRVAPEDFTLIDVRSDPRRDPRDHVLDIAFYAEVDGAHAKALDEVAAIRWFTAEELDAGVPFAFDHDVLWQHTRERILGR